jgi:NitT/TauT family transport system substrate-binding protein
MKHPSYSGHFGAGAVRAALPGILAIAVLFAGNQVLAQEKVKFGTGSAISLTSAPLTTAIGMGFFKEEGLEVEVIPFKAGSGVLIPQIANKSVLIGFPTADVMVIARQPGRDYLPLKFFYNMTRTSIYEVVVLDNSPVKQLSDLRGKKIGVGGLTWGSIPIAKAMFKEEGIEVGKDLELIAVGQGAAAYQSLTSGRIEALYLFDVPHAELESMGTKIRRVPIKDKFNSLGSNSLMAHEDTIKNQGKTLVRFGRAIAKGTIACDANTPAAVKMFWNYYPELKPTQGSEEEKMAHATKVVRVRLERMLSFPSGSRKNFGEFPAEMWKTYVEVMYAGGQISTPNIPVDSMYTNEFVQEFNQFDIAAVVRAAKALK